ncbi:MAG: RnfABCDGE type electron transport complex subunit D [Desulfobacterales bacterium]|nr:RnfABCDGE type electron transport complex subunit D [Desulfobacterales bacterium]
MSNQIKFIVSHAPFWHDGSSISQRSYHIIIAALPAVLFGIFQYGLPAVAVVSLSVSCAIFWELAMNFVTKRSFTIGDGNAALIGLLFAMLVPATLPWLAVLTGTFVAVIIGKQIFGGIGSNAFNPVVLAIAILMVSWKDLFDFDEALLNYDLEFAMLYPIAALKHFGPDSIEAITAGDLLLGKQTGGIGATFGLGLIIGGIYLIIRGFIRWEICLTFLVGVFATALIFNLYDGSRFAGPVFHTLTGYTLIGAFFLATEDSSSPVNFIPMLIFGAGTGALAVLIRNIGAHVDGVIYAILVMNLINPILDKIRPKAIGRVN